LINRQRRAPVSVDVRALKVTPHLAFRKGVRAIALAIVFGAVFAMGGVALGFVVGLAVSALYEEVLHLGNAQGPLLMLLTGPLGALTGLVFGFWKGLTMRDPDPRFNQAP
jgi:hypothetical protein